MYLYRSSLRKHLQEHEDDQHQSHEEEPEQKEQLLASEFSVSPKEDSSGQNLVPNQLEIPSFESDCGLKESQQSRIKAFGESEEDVFLSEPNFFTEEEPRPSKFIFVDSNEKLPSSPSNEENICLSPNFLDLQFMKNIDLSAEEILPKSPPNFFTRALEKTEYMPKTLSLTSLLGSPLRDRPTRNTIWEDTSFPRNTRGSLGIVYYKGQKYFLYDKMLNRYKKNGELEVIEIENSEMNPSGCVQMPISYFYGDEGLINDYRDLAKKYSKVLTFNMLMSENNCNSLRCQASGQTCDYCHHRQLLSTQEDLDKYSEENKMSFEELCAEIEQQRTQNPEGPLCLCAITQNFKHIHGPNCGHPAVYHDMHLDYIVNGRLQHLHGDHYDDHGPICWDENNKEDLTTTLVPSYQIPETKDLTINGLQPEKEYDYQLRKGYEPQVMREYDSKVLNDLVYF